MLDSRFRGNDLSPHSENQAEDDEQNQVISGLNQETRP